MHYKKCEICGLKSGRDSDQKRIFMAQFPLDEDRCKQWVKFTAKEDLVYVPIEKLHSLKYICGNHFEKKDFNKNGTRLNKKAIPSKLLPVNILPDNMLEDFPCHIASHTSASETLQQPTVSYRTPVSSVKFIKQYTLSAKQVHTDHDYYKHKILPQTSKSEIITPLPFQDANAAENSAAEASHLDEDGVNDNNFDDDHPQPTVPEHEEEPEPLFSWQKDTDFLPTEIMDNDNDSIICPSVVEAVDLLGPADFSMYCDDEPKTAKSQPEPITSPEHPAEYQCNECWKDIVGFRYTCVQCADWDLCGACEARTAHATHYVLRVPSPRPYNEIKAVLAAIRQQLLTENLFLNQGLHDDSLKVEVKDEPSEAPPAPEPDPLGDDSDSDYRGDNTQAEDSSEESVASSSSPHKRRSHRSLGSDKTDEAIAPCVRPVPTVQEDDPTISDHIDLTTAVDSDNATYIPTSNNPTQILSSELSAMILSVDKPTRIATSNNPSRIISSGISSINPNLISVDNPTRKPAYQNVTKSLAQMNPLAPTARDNITSVLAYNIQPAQSNNPTILIPTSGDPTAKGTSYKPTRLLASNSPTRKVVHDYVTQKASDNKGQLAESPAPHRVQPTDDVISLDDTPNTTSIGNLNTVARHTDPQQSRIVGSNNVPLDPSEAPDRVEGSLETSPSQLPAHHQTIVLRSSSNTNDVDLARTLQSKVTVRLEPLRIKGIDYIPAKKKKTDI